MDTTTKKIGYWAATGLLVMSILSGGIAELMHRPETVDGMKLLGYPVYFVMILGFWKVLASAALLAPGFPRLKEWTYAGIFFNFSGALVSHLVCSSAAWHDGVMLTLIALTITSWALRPASRRLGNLLPQAARTHLTTRSVPSAHAAS